MGEDCEVVGNKNKNQEVTGHVRDRQISTLINIKRPAEHSFADQTLRGNDSQGILVLVVQPCRRDNTDKNLMESAIGKRAI